MELLFPPVADFLLIAIRVGAGSTYQFPPLAPLPVKV
jgi:hypothetical protein